MHLMVLLGQNSKNNMTTTSDPKKKFTIRIIPKKAAFDPLAKSVLSELVEAGETSKNASVKTERLYRIEGPFTGEQIQMISETLLEDPIVELAEVEEADQKKSKEKKKADKSVITVDVWPKPGVTDPVGETVEKGLRDMGFLGEYKTISAQRYIFSEVTNPKNVEYLAQKILANHLIHDIIIHN